MIRPATFVFFLFPLLIGATIFGLAGRWNLWNVWVYLAIFATWIVWRFLPFYRKNPEEFNVRKEPAKRGRFGFTYTFIAPLVALVLHWGIVGLDQRFHWSDIFPPAGIAAGLVMAAAGIGLFSWAVTANPFYTSEVRIQAERGQRVISAGPYAIVRHPGYAGIILLSLASGVALNSLLSIVPVLFEAARLVYRMLVEDRMLRDELAGYAEYAAKVCYRLIPGVW